jgi:putative hydrolase of the HAD superfamily
MTIPFLSQSLNVKNSCAVIFDLDDTLYPERDYVYSGFRAVAEWTEAQFGIPALTGFVELKDLFEQGIRSDTFRHWLRLHKIEHPEFLPEMIQMYRNHQPVIQPFPGVPELLTQLRKSFLLGVLTDGELSRQTKKMIALGLEPYFDDIVFSDHWGREAWKPNPWIFHLALKRIRVAGKKAIYVADNPQKDFFGAKSANIQTIRLRIPNGLYSMIEPQNSDYAPDQEVTSLAELARIFSENC